MALGAIDFEVLESRQVRFECSCSEEKALNMIASLGKAEIASMLKDDKGAVMNCGFCNETYRFGETALIELLPKL
ncbi:Hsp33 family molecular chaperone HslO [Leptolyngbya sp. 7M]|nr:Hsp33 family molecular chaperone HslO [Leptolyngbya sp. 7M]